MKQSIISLCIIIGSSTFLFSQSSSATYSITFDSNWSQATHPHSSGSLPANAHWSKLVGATHSSDIVFLEMGQIATQGIEDVAELGNNVNFIMEVNQAISNGLANQYIDGSGLDTALGQIYIDDITTTNQYPYLTVVSMIAPSPDWMIAGNSIALLDVNNEWRKNIVIDLYPYDAGTDSGIDYTSPDDDMNPPAPINSAQGISPFSSEKIGTLTITLQEVLEIPDASAENTIQIYPNPVKEKFVIKASKDRIESLELYNVLGEKIKQLNRIGSYQATINMSELGSGIYLLRIISANNKSVTKKIIKL